MLGWNSPPPSARVLRARLQTKGSPAGCSVVPLGLVAEKVKHQLLCRCLGRERLLIAKGAIGLGLRLFLAILSAGRARVGARLLLRLGLRGPHAWRGGLLVGSGRLIGQGRRIGRRLVTEKLTEPLQRALLERGLVDLAVLDKGTRDAAGAPSLPVTLPGSETKPPPSRLSCS
jgi:hypothetical protein